MLGKIFIVGIDCFRLDIDTPGECFNTDRAFAFDGLRLKRR